MEPSLAGKVALVTGATRGAGTGDRRAARCGRRNRLLHGADDPVGAVGDEPAGDDRGDRRPHRRRPAVGRSPCRSTTSYPTTSAGWSTRIDAEQGALHVLVNNIWGATTMEWDKTVWESSLDLGPAHVAAGRRHPRHHQPLRPPAADPAARWTGRRGDRRDRRVQRRALPRLVLLRPGQGGQPADGLRPGARGGAVRGDGGGGHAGLAAIGGDARGLRRDGGALARRHADPATLRHLGEPVVRRSGRSPHWPPIPTWPDGTASRCPAGSWPRSTASPISTAAGRMRGATSGRSRTPACPPTRPGTADRCGRGPRPDHRPTAVDLPRPARCPAGGRLGRHAVAGAERRRSPTCSPSRPGGRRHTPGPPDPTGRCSP